MPEAERLTRLVRLHYERTREAGHVRCLRLTYQAPEHQQATQPRSAAQAAVRFKRLKPEKIEPLPATLAVLNLLRQTPEGTSVAQA